MPLLNHSNYWYFDTQGPNNNELIKELRTNSMFMRLKDWENVPDDYYLIEFKAIKAIERINLVTIIPPEILSRIKTNEDNCYLILENFHEGFTNIIKQIYNCVITRYGIPAHKVILFSGALDIQEKLDAHVEKYKVEPFKLESMLEFELAAQSRMRDDILFEQGEECLPKTLQTKKYKKKYINFNRRWRSHRPLLVALLKVTNLLQKGYVSLARADDNRGWETEMDHILEIVREHDGLRNTLMHHRRDIENMGPLTLDKDDMTVNYAHAEMTPKLKQLYEDTYFSVVSETIYFSNHRDWEDSCFLSEKVFKAIMFKHPFILVATPNTLKYLRSIGYKTFSPLIDENYDSIEDNSERMIAIVKEIDRLCKLRGEALESFLKHCRKITEHNYNTLMNKKEFSFSHYNDIQ